MKTLFKLTTLILIIASFNSCSQDTEVIEESNLVLNEKNISDKQIEIEVLEEINNYRISIGLNTLKKASIIKDVAHNHTMYMIENNKMSHENFKDRSSYLITNFNANRVGENVAFGYRSAKAVVKAWLNSPSHKATIEGNYTFFDVAAEQNERGQWFFTNLFVNK